MYVPTRHICTVQVTDGQLGRIHPETKQLICSLVTCGECQSIDNDEPSNICRKHHDEKNPSSTSFLEQYGLNNGSGGVVSTVKKHVSWESVEKDTSCYVDQSLWIELLQDEGIDIEKRCPKGYLKPRNKATRKGNSNKAYKELCDLSNKLFELYSSKTEYFNINVKRQNDAVTVILGWIVDKRQRHLTSVKNVTVDSVSCQEYVDTIAKWNKAPDDAVYMMDQSSVLFEAFNTWGNNVAKVQRHLPNDYVRLVAVVLHPDNRDLMNIVLDERKSRADLDDPSRSKTAIFETFAAQFSADTLYRHPQRWDRIDEKNLDNKEKVDPNDPQYKRKSWTGLELKVMYEMVMKKYKEVSKKWQAGTGGGPGAPENYEIWQERADELFQNYTGGKDFIPWLTWVYVMDMSNDGLLMARYEGLPEGIGSESGADSKSLQVKKRKHGPMSEVLVTKVDSAIKNLNGIMATMLEKQFIEARDMYETLTIKILESTSSNITPFQMKVMKRNRKESCDAMLRLQAELRAHGIRKEVEVMDDESLDQNMLSNNST